MSASWLLIGTLLVFAVGYRWYGNRLARVFGIDPARVTPAHSLEDGIDYVPAKNWMVLFGHHFSSICGAGPIIGPALAVAYWGWAASLLWLVVGCVLMGAVADFTSLFVSMRSDGFSIPEIAKPEISPRARLLFSWFIWVALVLVIAVFAIFAARTFIEEPDTVVPSFALIPVAVLIGHLLYRTKMSNSLATIIGLSLLLLSLFGGTRLPVEIPSDFIISPEAVWILVLLVYCFVASVTPVQALLQPRDYLASFLLFAAIGIGVVGVFVSAPVMQSDALHAFDPEEWKAAGPLWPMLFVTIACGAISGFHSLVSSGTTCKQISNESHACRIGYGGMLTEGLVGVLVVICVGAALSREQLGDILRTGGPIPAFSEGYGLLSAPFMGDYGKVFAVMALNAFILTTLDTATRIGRYLTTELFGINNMYLATATVVGAGAALALTGQWRYIWPAFGTSNQLIAALALLVGSCWLLHRGRPYLYTLIPACIMIVTTLAAFIYQLYGAVTRVDKDGAPDPDLFIASVVTVLIVLGIVVFWEGIRSLGNGRRSETAATARA